MKIQNANEREIINKITPIVKELEKGWNNNDYEIFIQHVANDKKQLIDIENFKQQRSNAIKELGKSSLGKLIKVHKNPGNVVAIWEIKFEKRSETGIGVYRFIETSEGIKVESSLHHH